MRQTWGKEGGSGGSGVDRADGASEMNGADGGWGHMGAWLGGVASRLSRRVGEFAENIFETLGAGDLHSAQGA